MFNKNLHNTASIFTSHNIQIDLNPELATSLPETESKLMLIP